MEEQNHGHETQDDNRDTPYRILVQSRDLVDWCQSLVLRLLSLRDQWEWLDQRVAAWPMEQCH